MATITTANGGLDVCREALVLLRQDRDLPVSGGALDVSSDVVAKKVDRVYDSTRALVIGAHGWDMLALDEQGDAADITKWPKQIRAAFVALLARELAIPVTGRQEDLKAMHELYTMKLGEAVRKDLEGAIAAETDKLVLAVYAVCKGYLKEGEPLPWSWAGFKGRVGDAKGAALLEVKNAHGWSTEFTGDAADWRYPAYERLVTAKMAASVGAGVDQQNLLLQAYKVELETAKKKDLETSIAAETDKLVLAVYAICKGYLKDGEPLPWSWAGFKGRVNDAKGAALLEVKNAHGWSTEFTGGATDWRYPAYERLVTAKMAASVGAGVDQQNLLLQAYKVELETAKKKDLEASIAAETDKLVLAVYAVCKGYLKEGEPLPWSWAGFKGRVGDAKGAALLEVKNAHGWSTEFTGDAADWRYPAYERLVTAKMAASVGAGVDQQNLLMQAYKVELETAKKKDLEASIAAETDKLVLAVYAVCKGYLKEGEPLPWSWAGFKGCVGDAKGAALLEVKNAHGWSTEFTGDASDWRYPAYERLVTAKMAASVGAGVDQQNLLFKAYLKALDEAVAKDWRMGIRGEQDPVVREAFVGIEERANGDGRKDWNYGRMREIVLQLKDRIRKEVLEERDWNFARRSVDVTAECVDEAGVFGSHEVTFRVPVPPLCVKVHSVDGRDGTPLAKGGWWIEDGFLKCLDREPVRITYTADVRDVDRWDSTVREAYFTLLMCRIAKATPEIGVRAQLLNGEYAELIRKAALRDAKETQPGRVVWGTNDYADAIRGFQGRRVPGFQGCRGRYA